ncbi:hypothetical protein HJC23_013002 [Cyclotella cryptica]|uniref:Uncharacterized protein n=1 Tax=Cyclotella cryptica TaxID=29204 RepID=A0ABD3QGT2_9STRA|eukprot:CCRYP_005594-RA/>CCRYP_005594-RA protein AED:0.22 eAED:0.22 QI:33/1/1/1/0/0/2/795/414
MTTLLSLPSTAIAIITPLHYLIFLTFCLAIYLAYLILPRGCRAHYCGTARRRYRRDVRHRPYRGLAWEQTSTVSSDGFDKASETSGWIQKMKFEFPASRLGAMPCPEQYWGDRSDYSTESTTEPYILPGFQEGSSNLNGSSHWYSSLVYEESKNRMMGAFNRNENPDTIQFLHEMKHRLSQCPGIKMIAHGTKCNPRPVWITLHFNGNNSTQQNHTASTTTTIPLEYQNCLTWRAELKRQSNSLDSSTVKLGNLRRVAFHDVVGIERGKRTTALRRIQTAQSVNENECFSLFTKSGTVDLQCTHDLGDAAEVREVFIALLGMALRSKGLAASGFAGVAAGVNNDERQGNDIIQSSNTSGEAGRIGIAPVLGALQSSNRKSDHTSGMPNECSDSSHLSGPMSSVTTDANLSIVSF